MDACQIGAGHRCCHLSLGLLSTLEKITHRCQRAVSHLVPLVQRVARRFDVAHCGAGGAQASRSRIIFNECPFMDIGHGVVGHGFNEY